MKHMENLEATMNLVLSKSKRKPVYVQLWEGKERVWK